MKSKTMYWLVLSLGICIVTGCGAKPGVKVKPVDTGLDTKPKPTDREISEKIATAWDVFDQSTEIREQRRAITLFTRLGAAAESEIPKLQEIADNTDYDEEVREKAKRTIENIKKKVEEAAE